MFQAIAEAASDKGACSLPQHKLAGAARLSRVSAQEQCRWLRANEWVYADRGPGGKHFFAYQINLRKLERAERGDIDPLDLMTEAQRAAYKARERLLRKRAKARRTVQPVRTSPVDAAAPSGEPTDHTDTGSATDADTSGAVSL